MGLDWKHLPSCLGSIWYALDIAVAGHHCSVNLLVLHQLQMPLLQPTQSPADLVVK